MSEDNIKVTVKVRPLIRREKENKLTPQWLINGNQIQHIDQITDPYTFDHVFDGTKTTKEMFDCTTKPIVHAAINGINGTIFAYGQTSSGKTHTMFGTQEEPGVIILAIREIFQTIEHTIGRQFLLRVGYIEIYNEKILDLLDKRKNVEIKDNGRGEVKVCHSESLVRSEELIIAEITKGNKERTTGETNMNERSSRSHAIFRIIIESTLIAGDDDDEDNNDDEDNRVVQTSYLNLVDLAGSERANQTGATGNRLIEANNINKSLLSLSRVIHKLSENNSQSAYINYRDSKLTRILQASLGGNAMTAIICCVTPAATEETSSTLIFGTSAKSIKNQPIVNEVISDAVCMKRLKKEIRRLENELEQEKQLRNSDGQIKIKLTNQISERQQQFLQSKKSTNNQGHRRRTWCPSVPHSPIVNNCKLMGPPQVPPPPLILTKSPNFSSFNFITTRANEINLNDLSLQCDNLADMNDDFEFVTASESLFTQQAIESDFVRHKRSTTPTDNGGGGGATAAVTSLTPRTLEQIIATPKGWRSVRPFEKTKLANDNKDNNKTIEQLQQEFNELSDFTNLERIIGSPYTSDPYLKLKSELKDAQNQIQLYRLEQSELMAYRDGLMRKSLDANITDDNQKISDLQAQILEFEKQLTIGQTERQQFIADNSSLVNKLTKQQQKTKSTEMEKNSIEFEYEQYKLQTKRREKELIDALNENQLADNLKPQIDELAKQKKDLEVEKWNNGKLIEQLNEKSQLQIDQINDLTTKLIKLEEIKYNFDLERNEWISKNQKLNLNYEKLQLEYEELSQQMLDAVQEQDDLNKKLQTNKVYENENQLLNVEIVNLKESLTKLNVENSTNLTKLIDSNQKTEQLCQENFSLKRQVIQFEQELNNHTDQLDEIEKINDLLIKLKEENQNLQQEIQLKSNQIIVTDDLLSTSINETTTTETVSTPTPNEQSNEKEKIYNLTQENCLLQQKLNGWCEENEQLSEKINLLQIEIKELKENVFNKETIEIIDLQQRYEDVSIKLTRYEPLKAINEILESKCQQFETNLNVTQKNLQNYEILLKNFINLFDKIEFSTEFTNSNETNIASGSDIIEIFNQKLNFLIKYHVYQKELIENLDKKLITIELHFDSQLFALRTELNHADTQLTKVANQYKQQIDSVDCKLNKKLMKIERKYEELIGEKDENQKLLENLIEKSLDFEDRLKNKDNLINQLQLEIDQLEKQQQQPTATKIQKDELILWIKTKAHDLLNKNSKSLNFKFDLLESISELFDIQLIIQENTDKLEILLLNNDYGNNDDTTTQTADQQLQCTNLETKIKSNKQKMNKDFEKLKTLEIELEEKCEKLNKLNLTNELNEKDLTNLKKQYECRNDELFVIKEQEQCLKIKIQQSQQEIDEKNELNKKLELDFSNLNVQLKNLTKDYETLKIEHNLIVTEKNELYSVVENNRQVIEQTVDECNVMRQSYLVCIDDIKKLQQQNDILREKQQLTIEKIDNSTTEQYKQIKAINQQQELQITQLKLDFSNEKQQIEKELNECQKQLDLAKENLIKIDLEKEKSVNEFHEQIKRLTVENDKTIKENKELKNQMEKLQTEQSILMEKFEKQIQCDKETILTIKSDFNKKSIELNEICNKFNKITGQLQQKNEEKQKLEQEIIKEKEKTLNAAKQEKEQFKLKILQLNENFNLSQKMEQTKFIELQKKLTETQTRQLQLENETTVQQKQLTDENLQLTNENLKLTTELNDIKNCMRSEESFNEKLQRIHELEIGVVNDKQKLMGENNDLRAKNQNLRLEIDEMRHRLQNDRKDRRRSTHDETRNALFPTDNCDNNSCTTAKVRGSGGSGGGGGGGVGLCGNNKRNIEIQTVDPIEPCGCQMMSQKIQQLNKDMCIRDCQLAAMKLTLDNNPIRVENASLIKQISQLKMTIEKQDDKINDLLLEEKQYLLAKQQKCAICINRLNLKCKNQYQQTDGTTVENNIDTNRINHHGSALVTQDENYRLKDELLNIRKKYDLAKKLCLNRSSELEKLKTQIKTLTSSSSLTNKTPAALSDNGVGGGGAGDGVSKVVTDKQNNENPMMMNPNKNNEKENTPDNNIPNVWSEQIKKQAIAHENEIKNAHKLSAVEISRLRGIIDDMEVEIKEISDKYEMAKHVCSARNRQIKLLESKIQSNGGDGVS